MSERPVMVALDREELERLMRQAALAGAQSATEVMQREYDARNTERRDRRLHNTRLLLKHYREFKEHSRKAVSDSRMAEPESQVIQDLMMMRDDKVILESIRRSIARTQTIIVHIDKMLAVYKAYASREGEIEKRRYNVIQECYLTSTHKSATELAELYGVSKVTIHNDKKVAEEKLSVLFFGLDGLHFIQ